MEKVFLLNIDILVWIGWYSGSALIQNPLRDAEATHTKQNINSVNFFSLVPRKSDSVISKCRQLLSV